jgi:hypothetical protein
MARCNTCRRRHVKCSEEKPICSRCTKGGFTCEGYTRKTTWHHLTTAPSSSADGQPGLILGSLVVLNSKPDAGTKPDRAKQPAKVPHADTLILHRQISLDAFKEDLCFAYIFSNFVWRGYGASWLYQSAQGLVGQLAWDSVTALAEISFGRSQKAHQIEVQGRIKYGNALRCLVEKLGGRGQYQNLRELVIPILLLLMHAVSQIP